MVGLARYEGAPAEQLQAATRQAMTALVDLAVKEGVEFILIAGDLYDGDWKDYHTGLFFAHQMSRLRDADIRVFIVAGNHDAASQMTKTLRLPENVTRFPTRKPGTELLEDLGVAVHGQGFPTPAVTTDLSAGFPPALPHFFNIGLLHTSVTGRPGHEPYAPCTKEGLLTKGYDYWALGHVHQREILHQDPWVVFPGNLQGRHIRETGSKGCTLVTVAEGQVAAAEHVDLDVLRWAICRVDAAGAETGTEVVDIAARALEAELAGSDGRPLAIRLSISGPCHAHENLVRKREYWASEIIAAATDVCSEIWIEKVLLGTTPMTRLADLLAGGGVLASFLQGLQDLSLDEHRLAELGQELTDLHHKLPHELRSGPDALALDQVEFYRRALSDVKEFLLSRLLARGGTP